MVTFSDFITPITTVIVGSVAYVVYLRQKRDVKRDAANIILIEIINAERQLSLILSADRPTELPKLLTMPNHSWDQYKYHFVKDFKQNEWDKITMFYSRCLKYDRAVEYNDSFFKEDIIRIRDNTHKYVAEIAKEFTDEFPLASTITAFTKAQENLVKSFKDKRTTFEQFYGENKFFYSPLQPINEATEALKSLDTNLSVTSVGTKLTKLSKQGFFSRFLSKIGL